MKIYHDGAFVACDTESLKRLSPGHVSGLGMFETLRTFRGQPVFLQEHLDRMSRGLALIGARNPFSSVQWTTLIQQALSQNDLKEARIRLMVWKDKGRMHRAIVAQTLVLPSKKNCEEGYALTVADVQRPLTRLSHVKCTDYQLFLRAHQQAQTEHCDDAILLNSRKYIVETSRSNLFWIRNNQVFTPAVETGCLNGIVRQKAIDLLRKKQRRLTCVQAPLDHLLKAEAAFVTNSVIGVMPVRRIFDHNMNARHPWLTEIMDDYHRLIVAAVPA